ncbi:Oligoxyloglucan reducing end-specific cellobiohydrolase [Fomitiporia mediterranea MF3/22]|uniref:Oligoxyloglucan reducing end-specific cellobiohydrolase n=1 Tax=Fomitiporia mediterranea (strain MF3/22) TaxID=694068 RepID=UPI0004407A6D|nr:Oligoxyloglucan reducing end-specific cellobiohydrolase [Fomitiporia mediterranea MF3/22]EJD03559.1 Oligoxyloglucan reducing end-specific cellobiohydrolase [Fomitiporia mediterranea MF3/22]
MGHDTHNVTLKSLANGMEETAVQGLLSPPTGPNHLSAILGVEGFVHMSLTEPPVSFYTNPVPMWSSGVDLDYAGNVPASIVRIGNGDSSTGEQVAISTDFGATRSQDYGAADNITSGKVAFSANGDTVLWRTSANGVQVSQYTNPFASVPTLPDDAQIASDKVNNSVFYGASGSKFYISKDGGKTFSSISALGSSTTPARVIVHPSVTGDVWVSTDKGIVTQAWSISLGAPAKTGGYPALFAIAAFGSQSGYFRSDDQGVNWVQINDASHGFGSFSANVISGDPRIFGRVYVGTNGRGICTFSNSHCTDELRQINFHSIDNSKQINN